MKNLASNVGLLGSLTLPRILRRSLQTRTESAFGQSHRSVIKISTPRLASAALDHCASPHFWKSGYGP